MPEVKCKHKKRRPRPKIKGRGKQYPINQSPLYGLGSKKKLEELLVTKLPDLKALSGSSSYRVFFVQDGKREIQAPCYKLDLIHAKLASYLTRLKVPEYLHSGVKGRSHITNARAHLNGGKVLTLDIQKFYPSVSQKAVYHFLAEKLHIATDVAAILAGLSCFEEHLPTGSKISMPLSFWCNSDLYEKLHKYCAERNVVMTVYVDDLTFSGEAVGRDFEYQVKKMIQSAGLSINAKKTKLYGKHQAKLITGVVIEEGVAKVRNKHHKAIYHLFDELTKCKTESEYNSKQKELIGRLNAAGQIDPVFKQRMRTYRSQKLVSSEIKPVAA